MTAAITPVLTSARTRTSGPRRAIGFSSMDAKGVLGLEPTGADSA